tara:strand:- start:1791 stop:2777 length:987 start_codon:yes stop_codon:yes gene_type:complete
MEVSEIERRTRKIIPQWKEAALELSLIEKGGSGRTFVRISEPVSGKAVVVVSYTRDRPDNERFGPITEFLNRHAIPSPHLIHADHENDCVWVEDLGGTDLGNLDGKDWDKVRRPAYESTLETVWRLHEIVETDPPDDLPELEPPFDEALYQWEQDYFIEQYVARFISESAAEKLRSEPSLKELISELTALPRSLVHRDFQSTNVMLSGGKTCLIDYQGMRWGVPEYDIASLVFDPYAEFSSEQRQDLIGFYFSLKEQSGVGQSEAEYRKQLCQCATQRLMQATGAYGFLGEVKGKPEFLDHIPAARERLVELASQEGGLTVLGDLLSQ